jgi:alkaline phosphatase
MVQGTRDWEDRAGRGWSRWTRKKRWVVTLTLALLPVVAAAADGGLLRIMPPDRSTFAVGQRFDIRVEATTVTDAPLRVFVDGAEVEGFAAAISAGENSVIRRGFALTKPGEHVVEARLGDVATARVTWNALAWEERAPGAARARNVILMIGDGMGLAHRTAARLVARGLADGRARGRLALDTLDVTGLVMTSSLDAAITDSAAGKSALVTGAKANNDQMGVFPDETPDPFDNPRVENLAEILRRSRGPGFRAGLVTTAELTDATPAGSVIHTAERSKKAEIAERMLDERERSGLSVLLGGGSRYFAARGTADSARQDDRDLVSEFEAAGFATVRTGSELRALAAKAVPPQILGLFHTSNMDVAFDKVGVGRYSDELVQPGSEGLRDQPLLPEMTRVALASLSAHAPAGFYLMVEGGTIDKRCHDMDAERAIWDVIEFDQAVDVALGFARQTNGDADPENDTLVVVTADHETGGLTIMGVGNEHYAPEKLGRAVRDYAATYRFVPNYEIGPDGFPVHPDPSRKLLLGWGSGADRFENWRSNRRALPAAVKAAAGGKDATRKRVVANRLRDGSRGDADNRTVEGVVLPGFLVKGTIENGETDCVAADGCPGDAAASAEASATHTGVDVPLSATGPGAPQFTGVYENTDVFVKILRSTTGNWGLGTPAQ